MSERARFDNFEYSENEPRNMNKNPSRKRLVISKRVHDMARIENASSLSMATSTFKGNSITEHDFSGPKGDDIEGLTLGYFTDKYLSRDGTQQQLQQEMRIAFNRKDNQLSSLRIYRDQLKLINFSRTKPEPMKLSVQTLKQKAELQQRVFETQLAVEKELRNVEREIEYMNEYGNFMAKCLENKDMNNSQLLDLGHEEQVMVNNLQMETTHLMNQLTEEQRRNNREIKQVQDEILDLRIMIQQKEDRLRDLKARICTMYIKLHSRASSRTGSKSKDRNMSLSVKKFNSQNHLSIRQAYIGNNAFKNYSKEVIEKVKSEQQLVKIKFFISGYENQGEGPKQKEQFSFQCIYKNRQGISHRYNHQNFNDDDATRDKISQISNNYEEVLVKYLFSMKFFYKSHIVGVQCRVKTQRGNKHFQIGNCDPNIQHQLLTLVNKKIVTMGSFWHGKEMIGVSVWYSEKDKNTSSRSISKLTKVQPRKSNKGKLQTFDQYYA